MRNPWNAVSTATVLMLAGCVSEPGIEVLPGSGDLHTTSFPVVNGAPPDAPEHGAVVSLHQLANGGNAVYVSPFCTGTLIADTVVLTAAHCLDTARGGANFKTMPPTALAIYVGDEPAVDIGLHMYRVGETLIHPSYDRNALRNDIALVRLQSAVTEDVAPVPPLPASLGFSAADIGSLLNFAGFGQDEDGHSGVKLQGDWPLGGLGCTVGGCPTPGDAATQISYGQATGGVCFGDSGGPAFAYRGGTAYVGGITSYGDSRCRIYGVSTRVDAFESFIGDFLAPDPDPDPVCVADGFCDPACAAGADPDCDPVGGGSCGDGICGAGESCDGRNGTTACSDCAGVVNGRPAGRYCFVEGACQGDGCP